MEETTYCHAKKGVCESKVEHVCVSVCVCAPVSMDVCMCACIHVDGYVRMHV